MSSPKILAFSGSARAESWNQKLVIAAANVARTHGAEVTLISLADYPLPLFDEDLEKRDGMPDHAEALKDLFKSHDGLLIACPEYNSSITPLLKNTIDWVSRTTNDDGRLAAYSGKTAALLSGSLGGLGGLRGLVHVRAILASIGVIVLPDQHAIGSIQNVIDDAGAIADDQQRSGVELVVQRLVQSTAKLK